jgi:hypothetical protein
MTTTSHNPQVESAIQDSPGDQVLSIIADVEKQLERIRSAQSNHSEEIASLEQRSKALEQAEQGLQAARRDVEERDRALASQLAEFKQQQARVQADREQYLNERSALDQSREQLERGQSEVKEQRATLERELERSASMHSDIERQQSQLQAQREAFAASKSEFDAQNEALQASRAELTAKLVREDQELTQIRSENKTLAARVEKAEGNVGELIARIEGMQDELDRRQAALDEAKARCEKSELDGLHMIEQAEAQRDELASKLKQAESAVGEIQAQSEASIRETTQLRSQLAQRETTLAETNEKLRVAGTKLAQFSEAIQKQTQELEHGAAAVAECQQLRRTVERMQETLKQKEADAAAACEGDATSHSTAAFDSMQTELTRLRTELEHRNSAIQKLGTQVEQAATNAEARLLQLSHQHEQQMSSLQAKLQLANARGGDGSSSAASNMQEKAKIIQEAAAHLRRRKQRLERVKTLIKRGSAGAAPAAADQQDRSRQMRELQEKKESLIEVQKCLASSEQQMMRRWARPRAFATICWLVLLTGIVGVASWVGAGMWQPPTISASVVIEAKTKSGQSHSEADLAAWQTAHQGMLHDGAFITAVSRRLADRQISRFSDATKLELFLKENLTADSDRPGLLRLTLRGTDVALTPVLLDTVATTLTSESAKGVSRRADGIKAGVAGEKAAAGRVEYASLNAAPVKDERFMYAAILFGAGMTAVLFLWAIAYKLMLRSKRVFDKDMGLIDDGTTIALN